MTQKGATAFKVPKNRDAYLQYRTWAMCTESGKLWHQAQFATVGFFWGFFNI